MCNHLDAPVTLADVPLTLADVPLTTCASACLQIDYQSALDLPVKQIRSRFRYLGE